MKKLLALVVALGLAAAGYLYLRLDFLVKDAIETYGSRLLKARVTVSRVSLSPFSGAGSLNGLEIGSPQGFSEPYVLRVESVRVRVEPKSLTTDKIVVREVTIEGPELHYERNASGSNLDALQRNLAAASPADQPKAKSSGKPKKIVIDRFSAKGGKTVIAVFGAKADVPLPDVEAKGIGEGGGATPAQAAQRLLGALGDAAVKAVGGSKAAAQNLGGAVSNALKGLLGR